MSTTSDKELDRKITASGATAPRVTPERIDGQIAGKYFFTAAQAVDSVANQKQQHYPTLTCLTFCVLVLKNGFTVTGESACASPENYNQEIGEHLAYENARRKIWPLEGYLLRQTIYENAQ